MELYVTRCTYSDEVLCGVVSEQAALPNMMDVEVTHGSTLLAPPSVSMQHPFS
jgi:hypothetical protein